jgi:hypothetical protein
MIREQSDSGMVSRDEARKTNSALHYQESLFESVSLRAVSMEKRMQNVINLVSHAGPMLSNIGLTVGNRAST